MIETVDIITLEKYFKEREPLDYDLVFLTNLYIKEYIGAEEARLFVENPMIVNVASSNSASQRVIINRYFSNLLLRFRSKINTPINDVNMMLVLDGTPEDWFTLFREIIAPFLKEHNVFKIVFAD
jgi:hypothetical protein